MTWHLGLICLTLATLSALVVEPVSAQQPVVMTGSVTDISGGVLPGSTLEILSRGQVVATVKTGPNGRYRFELPSEGRYQISVHREGFATQTVDVTVAPGVNRDFQLRIAPLDDTVVVTASRTPERSQAVTESLMVFTAEDIQRLGSHSIAEVVRQVPGLQVEVTGREGALASLFARGGKSDYNHVLIDGVPVNVSGGQFDFSRVSGAEIDRVEVVRGAQSALYGSDAIGSVVQIFTKRGTSTDAPQLSGSVEGGSFGTWRGDMRVVGGAQQRVDYQLGVTYRGTNGAFPDMLPESDRFDQTSVNGGVGIRLRDQITLRTGFRDSDAQGRAVGQIAYGPGDRGTRADTEDLSWHLRFDQLLMPAVHHTATVTYFRSDQVSEDAIADPPYNVHAILEGQPGARFPESPRLVRLLDQASFETLVADPSSLAVGQFLATTPFGVRDFPGTFESQFRRPSVKYQLDLTWRGNQVLSAGYEYERETDPLQDFVVEDHAYFAQQQFTIADRWFLTAGGRVDDHSHYGTEVSPKLSAGGYPLPFTSGPVSSLKIFTNIGKGIKNPAFSELFGSAFADGNPNLRPERARTMDAGIEFTFDDQRWLSRVTYFDNTYKDQVAFKFSPGFGGDGLPDFINIAGSGANGVELEASLQRPIAGVRARATYALVDTEVVTTVSTSEQFQPGQPLLRRPKHAGTLQVTYTRGPGSLHVQLRSVGQRHDASFLGLSRVSDGRPVDITVNPGYTVVGLGGQVRLDDDLTLFVRIDNLTDKKYESALGFPGLPRAVVLGGRFTVGR